MLQYPKRLIEVDLPIARISAHARREKSIRHGHISTLHIWWARRPLAACRAVICASLWPDPADELCPKTFREAAVVILNDFARRVNSARISEESKKLKETLSEESRGRWEAMASGTLTFDPAEPADMAILRMALLDFIADFANWDNSTVPAYLETARRLTGVAHASLSEAPFRLPSSFAKLSAHLAKETKAKAEGSKVVFGGVGEWMDALDKQLAELPRPLVVDPFAGGGSIPLEALRVGADAFASDLNPIPVLLNKVVLEYIPKYGQRLADEVRKWGAWIKTEAEKELAEFYPKDPDGATPIAYLWARTICCEGPACGAEVPLIRSLWLAKRTIGSVAMQMTANIKKKRVDVQIIVNEDGTWHADGAPERSIAKPSFDGTLKRGSATCPCCGYTTPVTSVRTQLKTRRGGAHDAKLLAVVLTRSNQKGRFYRLPSSQDKKAVELAAEHIQKLVASHQTQLSPVPDEIISPNELRRISVPIYGITTWGDMFSPRQSLALATLSRLVQEAGRHFHAQENAGHLVNATSRSTAMSGLVEAVLTCLALAVTKHADANCANCTWRPTSLDIGHLFGRQAIGMVWDFAEVNPTSGSTRDFWNGVEGVLKALESTDSKFTNVGHVEQSSATGHPLPTDSVDAFITDPPYYDAVPYAYLSDFFYVWLRRILGDTHTSMFREDCSPKAAEIVVDRSHALSKSNKGIEFYERELQKAFEEGRRVLRPSGIGTIVFASKTTSSWEAILKAVVEGGWIITGSWPIDTEMETRVAAQGQSRLASSVHLVCRPREDSDGAMVESVGEWRDVLGELPKRIHEWMPRLAAEGVVGADAIFACLGPALEVFSRYSRVEKANGDTATLREYLEFVWAAVSTEALSLIFKDADAAGLEPDARLTAMWLWTLGGGKDEGGRMKDENGEEEAASDDEEDAPAKSAKLSGFTLEYDAARKIAQGLGVHLEQCQTLVEVKGDKARMLPVKERAESLFGKSGSATAAQSGGKAAKKKATQKSLFEEMVAEEPASNSATWGDLQGPTAGSTVLDRVHQSMILFAAGRGELLKRFLVEDGIGKDARFWKLAQSLSALYPKECEEKRWVDGVLARKKGLGL